MLKENATGDANVSALKNRIKILERDLKNSRLRITKLKKQKNKLLEQLEPKPKVVSSPRRSPSLFFGVKPENK